MADQRKTQLVRGLHQAMHAFRNEVARELGFEKQPAGKHPAIRRAALEGEITRRMVELAERQLKK
ncbi:MAG: small, acid-soluble spore protein, alpha/beta type [Tumebacillaceae bacterium]